MGNPQMTTTNQIRYIVSGRTEDGTTLYYTGGDKITWSDDQKYAAHLHPEIAYAIVRGAMPVISVCLEKAPGREQ